jgi:hypothetical protein
MAADAQKYRMRRRTGIQLRVRNPLSGMASARNTIARPSEANAM